MGRCKNTLPFSEQALKQPLDGRSDLFRLALCCMRRQGKALFDGVNQFVILEKCATATVCLEANQLERPIEPRGHCSRSYSRLNATTDRPMLMPRALTPRCEPSPSAAQYGALVGTVQEPASLR